MEAAARALGPARHAAPARGTASATATAPHQQNRYYLCSLPRARLTADQWLYLIRQHWGVENGTHNRLDKFLAEDQHPSIEADPQGMLNVMLLRRMGLNALALFRGATQRGDDQRHTPWRELIGWFYNTLIAATASQLAELRPRSGAAVA